MIFALITFYNINKFMQAPNNSLKKRVNGTFCIRGDQQIQKKRSASVFIPFVNERNGVGKIITPQSLRIREGEQVKKSFPKISQFKQQQTPQLLNMKINIEHNKIGRNDPQQFFSSHSHEYQQSIQPNPLNFNSLKRGKNTEEQNINRCKNKMYKSVSTNLRKLPTKIYKQRQCPPLPAGYYEYNSDKYKFKRSPQIKISQLNRQSKLEKSVSNYDDNQEKLIDVEQNHPMEAVKKQKKEPLFAHELKHLKYLPPEQNPEIKKLLRYSKLSVKILDSFDNNFQKKLKDAMMNALHVKQMIYKT